MVVARLLLKPGRTYEQSVTAFRPYAEIRDPYPEGYRDAARMVKIAQDGKPPRNVYVAVNNRLVGNTPGAIAGIVSALDEAL